MGCHYCVHNLGPNSANDLDLDAANQIEPPSCLVILYLAHRKLFGRALLQSTLALLLTGAAAELSLSTCLLGGRQRILP